MKELLNMFNFYKAFKYYKAGKKSLKSKTHIDTQVKIKIEVGKESNRTEILNFLLSQFDKDTQYLELGVRNPTDNFSKIKSSSKLISIGFKGFKKFVIFLLCYDLKIVMF